VISDRGAQPLQKNGWRFDVTSRGERGVCAAVRQIIVEPKKVYATVCASHSVCHWEPPGQLEAASLTVDVDAVKPQFINAIVASEITGSSPEVVFVIHSST
jgi:hypothetical protein